MHMRARVTYIDLAAAQQLGKKLKSSDKSFEIDTPHAKFDRFSFHGCLREMGILPATPEYKMLRFAKNAKIMTENVDSVTS